ncbi:pollen receptor-like kinase 4 [Canna indica]|uniref:Pollen receptor-like kinase 4 n=1 Tax=Canna indica TaxID=4628 RepID=A0AAQ3PYK7_9LILI|nr:pollen receptor-like kinase 4 [Canna indica]
MDCQVEKDSVKHLDSPPFHFAAFSPTFLPASTILSPPLFSSIPRLLSPWPCHQNPSPTFPPCPAPPPHCCRPARSRARPPPPPMADEDQSSSWPLRFLTLILSLFRHPGDAPANDRQILLNFKATLSPGAGARALLDSWVADKGPCVASNVSTWYGVYCDDEARVSTVQLENMGLSGPLDIDLLTGLPGLRYLFFSNNSLEGRIPDITKLVALKSLYLTSNQFYGEIPDDLFKPMRALKKVWLSYNKFSGRIPSSLKVPAKLMEVGLNGNNFDGEIPELWQPELHLVDVSHNNLEGPIPERLSKMSASLFEGNKNLCGPPLAVLCPESKKKKFSIGLLIAVILIALLLLLLILGCIIFCLRRRRSKEQSSADQPQPSEAGRVEHLEAANVESPPVEHHGGGGGAKHKTPKKEQGKLSFLTDSRGHFDLKDLLRASAEVLGSGNFGSSYKASLVNGPAVVVKRFKEMNAVGREDFQEHMRRMGRLCHPNLLPLVAYYYRKEEKLLITDYTAGGSLAHMLHGLLKNNIISVPKHDIFHFCSGDAFLVQYPGGYGPKDTELDWLTRLRIIKGIARGLAYLYEELPMMTVPHGHLKSSNVLLDSSFNPMLSDYALIPVMNKVTASQVMVAYKCPECAEGGKPSKKSDVWSFGILILEILTGMFPANYLRQGSTSTDLSNWVSSVVKDKQTDEVFDKNMKGTKNNEEEMSKLLQIGLACCETNVETRLELKVALEKIEELKEIEGDTEDSNEAGGYASKATSQDTSISR